jgi:hypothetical protein
MYTCGLGGTGDLCLASTSAQFGRILHFLLEEVKEKDCYKDLLEVLFTSPNQIEFGTATHIGEQARATVPRYN